jgi:hypothetical protein
LINTSKHHFSAVLSNAGADLGDKKLIDHFVPYSKSMSVRFAKDSKGLSSEMLAGDSRA